MFLPVCMYDGKWREIGQKRKGGAEHSGGSLPLFLSFLKDFIFIYLAEITNRQRGGGGKETLD